jgi:beta-adrenergic-receptor kinase
VWIQSKISANIASSAIKIVNDYLNPESKGNPSSNEARRCDIVRVIVPVKKKMQPPIPYPGKPTANNANNNNSSSSGANSNNNAASNNSGDMVKMISPTNKEFGANGASHKKEANSNTGNSDVPLYERGSGSTAVNGNALVHAGSTTTAAASPAMSVPMAVSINQVVPMDTEMENNMVMSARSGGRHSPHSVASNANGIQQHNDSNMTMKTESDAHLHMRPRWAEFVMDGEEAAAASGAVKNAIRCFGEPVDKIIETVKTPSAITTHLFDELDAILFSFLTDKYFDAFKNHEYYQKFLHFMAMTEQPVTDDDFALFRVLGRGGFGMVSGCKRCYSGRLFAMKVMNKKRVKLKKAEALCLNERNILSAVDSPYVVCLKYAFTTPTDLYLVLDLMIGGDLGYHLQRKHSFTMAETKFYAARILLGIGALHDLSIVYRDLKPENVLMDEHGYTKISDLGLACRVSRSGLSGTCGTRGYWAPEMLRRDSQGKRERYSLSVDWFSFGCCIYEFLIGVSPFRTEAAKNWGKFPKLEKADKDKAIDLAIQEMDPDLDAIGLLDETTKDILRKLLNKDGKARLGAKGYRDIMLHPWFADIDFDSLNQMQPPMVPPRDINMATQSEIGSFADDKQSRKVVLSEADHKHYETWLFISTRAFQEEVVEFLLMEELLVSLLIDSYLSWSSVDLANVLVCS